MAALRALNKPVNDHSTLAQSVPFQRIENVEPSDVSEKFLI